MLPGHFSDASWLLPRRPVEAMDVDELLKGDFLDSGNWEEGEEEEEEGEEGEEDPLTNEVRTGGVLTRCSASGHA